MPQSTAPPTAASPHRLTPVDVLARDCYDAICVLGPVACFEDIARVAKSRPVLVRAAMDQLMDIGLVTATPDGCYCLPCPPSAA